MSLINNNEEEHIMENNNIDKAYITDKMIVGALAVYLSIMQENYKPKTSWNNIAEKVYSDFLAYAADEASGFLIDEIRDAEGDISIDRAIEHLEEFCLFGSLREDDIAEYDY